MYSTVTNSASSESGMYFHEKYFVIAQVGIQRVFARKLCSTQDVKPLQSIRETIYAMSSGQGRAAISIVRISGPHTAICVQSLCMTDKLPIARYASLRKIWNPATRILIDRCLVMWFPSPHSYTGEDSAEMHIHGSLAVQHALFDALLTIPNVRQAQAGEFTRRAFENDKLELTEVEGLADLLQAETEAQRKQALSQATGGLVAKYQEWQSILIGQMVRLEADIDFAEVDDFKIVLRGVYDIVENIKGDMEEHLADSVCAERVRIGCRTAFIGEPNVGKSSLLNQITQRNLAIVSAHAGTTRDVLEAYLDMGGYPVTLCDTAGLRGDPELIRVRSGRELTLPKRLLRRSRKLRNVAFGNPSSVEEEGMLRARREIDIADLLLVVVDATLALHYVSWMGKNATIMDYMNLYYEGLIKAPQGCAELESASDKARILIFNKIDLIPDDKLELFTSTGQLCVSSTSGVGIDVLQSTIVKKVEKLCDGSRCTAPRLSKKRHRQQVNDALRFLRLILFKTETSSVNKDRAVLAGTLSSAIAALETITGDTCKESLLDDLFSDFCIGK